MKTRLLKTAFLSLLGIILTTCQEEVFLNEDQIIPNAEIELNSQQLNTSELDDYLLDLKGTIETMVIDGLLNVGQGNALISKINVTIKSINRGNTTAADKQLKAFIISVKNFINGGILDADQGRSLINRAEGGVILIAGNFIDSRDGNDYSVMLIGKQIWMAENLAYLPSVSPPTEPPAIYPETIITDPYYYVYNYFGTDVNAAKATSYYSKCGVYYIWAAAMDGAVPSDANPSGVQGACPTGWHLPSDSEWDQMEVALGMTPEQANADFWHGTDQGTQMKSKSEWFNNGNGTNSSGFNGFPWAYRTVGKFSPNYSRMGIWWSCTLSDGAPFAASTRMLQYDHSDLCRTGMYNASSASIRCVKDY